MSEGNARVVDELNDVYERSPDTVTRRIAGETFIVTIKREIANMDRLYVLDEVSDFIWSRFDGKRTLADIAEQVTAEFDVDEARAATDLREFVEELESVRLIRQKR